MPEFSNAETIPISLNEWGPPVLYAWIYDNWNNSDIISIRSKQAMYAQYNHKEIITNDESLRQLVIFFKYEKLIMSLVEDDFIHFVNEPLKRYQCTYRDIQENLLQLRLKLANQFCKESINPSYGPESLIKNAHRAIIKAEQALLGVDPVINPFYLQKALEEVHDGVDRSLLMSERFMEFIIEFLAQVSYCYVKGVDRETYKRWLINAGVKEGRNEWGTKLKCLSEIAKEFIIKNTNITSSDTFTHHLIKLSDACYFDFKNNNRPKDIEGSHILLSHLDCLRDLRNKMRHSSNTLRMAYSFDVPFSYRQGIKDIKGELNNMSQDIYSRRIPIPTNAKLISCEQDVYGNINIKLIIDGERNVTVRYIEKSIDNFCILDTPMLLTDIFDRLVEMQKKSVEFFLFPCPGLSEDLILNPLLIVKSEQNDISKVILRIEREDEVSYQGYLEIDPN